MFDLGAEAGGDGRRAVLRWLEEARPEDVVDFSAAFDRLLVEFAPGTAAERRAGELAALFAGLGPVPAEAADVREIPVRYDGMDLAEFAARLGLGVGEVIARHAAPIYEVALLGFSPGFPYLAGLDPALHVPRRAMPRARVPAGAVAVGGSHTGIYSVESPGGWHLLGTTPQRIFDPGREPERMFLLRPGDRVKFVPVD